MTAYSNIERHPLQPFLPENARLLMLGSFPPPKERWCMPFFYPNPQNDMWRIMGLVFFGDKQHFVEEGARGKQQIHKPTFRYDDIVAFCREKGIAIFDTAQAVRRLQGNAADEHLEIVEPTDIAALLKHIPQCHDICCTGGKSMETLCATMQIPKPPKTGGFAETEYADRRLRVWRMPSSSRAYPLPLEKKAAHYQRMFSEIMNNPMHRKSIEVVAAIIQDDVGRIFATQRGYGDWKDWWEFPGGKIEAGETAQEALQREIREELDAEIEVGELLRTINYDYPAFHLTMHCFLCRLKEQKARDKDRSAEGADNAYTLLEHEAARWLAPTELTSVKWLPADEEIITDLQQMI